MSVPVLLPVPEVASAIAPVPLPTIRPASSFCRDDDDDDDYIVYRTVLCFAFCSGLLFPSNCTHLRRNTWASASRQVNPAVPVSLQKVALQSTTRHATTQQHNPATFGVILCCCSRNLSPACHLPLGTARINWLAVNTPSDNNPYGATARSCPAQPTSGFT